MKNTNETGHKSNLERLLNGNISDLLQRAIANGALQHRVTRSQETDDACSEPMESEESCSDPVQSEDSCGEPDADNETFDACPTDPAACHSFEDCSDSSHDCPDSSGQ